MTDLGIVPRGAKAPSGEAWELRMKIKLIKEHLRLMVRWLDEARGDDEAVLASLVLANIELRAALQRFRNLALSRGLAAENLP